MNLPPSGRQWSIRHGAHEATVVEIGGGLRTLSLDGLPGIAGYAEDEVCRSCRGQVLVPWPNRIRDGRYAFAGAEHGLALTEPDRGVALHGLVCWLPWQRRHGDPATDPATEHGDRVTVGTRLPPQPGWDWWFDVEVSYRLTDDGLTVDTTVTNLDGTPAPFGYAAHPYLALRGTPVAAAKLTVPAAAYLPVDEDRLLPVGGPRPVTADLDFRAGRAMGPTALDTAYTDLRRNGDGRWEVTLTGTEAGGVTLWAQDGFDWLQVYNGPMLPLDRPIDGVAVEPMTCAPDAFNTGLGLIILGPGERWTGRWGIAPAR